MKKFVFALFATMGLVGFVAGETFNAGLKKVDGSKITIAKEVKGGGGKGGKKGGKKGAPAEPVADETLDIASGAVIGKGVADPDTKGAFKLDGTAFTDGLKNEAFKDASADKSVRVRITTADEDKGAVKKGQVTQVLVIPAKGGKGGFGSGKGGKKGGFGKGTER